MRLAQAPTAAGAAALDAGAAPAQEASAHGAQRALLCMLCVLRLFGHFPSSLMPACCGPQAVRPPLWSQQNVVGSGSSLARLVHLPRTAAPRRTRRSRCGQPLFRPGDSRPWPTGLDFASCLQGLASAGDTACRAGEGEEGEVVYRASPSQRAAAAAQPGQAREGLDTARQRLISAVQRARDAQSVGPASPAAAGDDAKHALARRAAPSTAALTAGPLLGPPCLDLVERAAGRPPHRPRTAWRRPGRHRLAAACWALLRRRARLQQPRPRPPAP